MFKTNEDRYNERNHRSGKVITPVTFEEKDIVTEFGSVRIQNDDNTTVLDSDIDIQFSDNGGFSGEITDYFCCLKSVSVNSSSSNPKSIKIWFLHTIQTSSIGFGCDDLTKSFSNIIIKALGSGDEVRYEKDLSADNTKRNSFVVNLIPLALNGLIIEFHTADEVALSNLIVFKSSNVNSRIQAVNEVTGIPENINSFGGALNVTDGFVHKAMVNEYFIRKVGPNTTLAVAAIAGDIAITVDDSTGFIAPDLIRIGITALREVGAITITNVVGNVITIDRPIAQDLPIGTVVEKIETNMVSAIGTLADHVVYELAPPPGIIWQLTRLLITITDNAVMDDGKFGGIPALTNGIVGVAKTTAGRLANIANWKTNGDMMADMFDVEYNEKAPAGGYGLRGRWTLLAAGIISELNGDEGEYLRVLVQDDLTGNASFRIKGQGRVKNF